MTQIGLEQDEVEDLIMTEKMGENSMEGVGAVEVLMEVLIMTETTEILEGEEAEEEALITIKTVGTSEGEGEEEEVDSGGDLATGMILEEGEAEEVAEDLWVIVIATVEGMDEAEVEVIEGEAFEAFQIEIKMVEGIKECEIMDTLKVGLSKLLHK